MSNSYRQILRSTSIIGGASAINILVGLVRTKFVAVLLGPAGVGLIGLFQSLVSTASAAAALGFGTVGTRQIAEAVGAEGPAAMAAARRALFWGTAGLAIVGALAFWLLRSVLAANILGDARFNGTVGWLALGVALTVAAGSQGALLNGLRRIGDIARVGVLSAVLSAALGVLVLLVWGDKGKVAFVLSAPLSSFLLGYWYVSRLPKIKDPPTPLPHLIRQWKTLTRLGVAFMVAGLAVSLGQLAVRTLVQRKLGADALGHFQAAWAISMTYIGFVLQAMGTDYYPRLTATIHDRATTNRLVNEQTEVSLLLAGPVFVAMLGLAPLVINLLYSSRFDEAVIVLRWQVLGDIFKVAAWPLGFIILAAGDARTFMLNEMLSIAVLLGLTWIGLPIFGIEATGIAFLGMYLVCLPIVFWLAWRKTGFLWQRNVYLLLMSMIGLAIVVFAAALQSKWLGAVTGSIASAGLGAYGLARLGHMANIGGGLGRLAGSSRQIMKRLGVWRD